MEGNGAKIDGNNKLYQTLFENSNFPKILVNSNGIIIKNNLSFEVLFGYYKNEVIGKSVSVLMPKKYRENHGKYLESYVKNPENKTMGLGRKIEAEKKNGAIFPAEITLNYIENKVKIDMVIVVTISEKIYSEVKRKLIEKERVFDLATKAAGIGIWSAVRNFQKTSINFFDSFDWSINDEVKLLLGFSSDDELDLDKFMSVIHPEDLELVENAMSKAFKGTGEYDIVYRLIRPDMEIFYIESKGKVLFDENNIPIRLDGVMINITKSTESNKLIKESGTKLEQFFEMAPNGIARNDMDGNFISINKEFERFTGYTKDELNKLSYWDLTPVEYKNEEAVQLESLQQKGSYGPYEKEYIRKNGSRVPVLLNGVIIKDDYDGKDYIWSIVVDMTERIKVKNELLEYERFFSLNENMIAVLSKNGDVIKINSKTIDELGYSKDYLLANPFMKLVHPDDRELTENAFVGMYSGNKIPDLRIRLICENKTIKWVVFSAIIVEESGNLFVMAKDVTDSEKARIDIELLNSQLKEREHKYRQLFEKSGDAIAIVNNGVIVECNDAFVKLYGIGSREYYTGKSSLELSPTLQPDGSLSKDKMIEVMTQVLDEGTLNFDCTHIKRNGLVFPVEIFLTNFTNMVTEKIIHVVIRDISERKTKEQDLNESQVLLNNSQKLANMGSWKWEISTNEITWSDELYTIFGLDKESFSPSFSADIDLIHNSDKEKVRKIILNAVENKVMFQYDEKIVRPSGEIRYVKSWGNVIVDDGGNTVSLYGACLDVTKEKLQQEKHTEVLREQLRRNRRLISTTLDGYVLTTEDGEIVEVNKSYSKLIGYNEKELLKFNVNSLEANMLPLALEKRSNEIKTTSKSKFETKHIHKNGTLINVEVSLALVKIKGKRTMVAQFIRNVTERKENELRRTVFNNISQKLNSKISVFDFCKFLELELNKIISINSFYIMLYDKTNDHLSSIYINDRFIKNHENVSRREGNGLCEYVINLKKGLKLDMQEYDELIIEKGIKQYRTSKAYWMGAPLVSESNSIGIITVDTNNGQPYTDEDLALLEFIGIQLGRLISRKENSYKLRLLNTTLEERVDLRTFELKKAKDDLTSSLKKEKELSMLKSRFVSTASHQFRTPLTVIQTNLGILEIQKSKMDPDYRDKFDKISLRMRNQINKMTSMMDELLTIGKINENGINFNPKKMNIRELCEKVIINYNDIQEDGRVLELNIDGEEEGVYLDPILMEHVLSALISNAFKYSQNKPNPILTISFNKKELLISIKDFGIGIPDQDIEHIHEPFFRASNAIDISGTGLGTSIVKEYVEVNKGILNIESKLNEFTEFILIFRN